MGFEDGRRRGTGSGSSRWVGPISVPPGPAVVYQWSSRLTVQTLGGTAMALGLGILIGGPAKFSGSGFAVARTVPGGAYTWGSMILLCGIAIMLSTLVWNRKAISFALAVAAGWNAAFASFIAAAAVSNRQTSLTGFIIYSSFAVMCLVQRATSKGLST